MKAWQTLPLLVLAGTIIVMVTGLRHDPKQLPSALVGKALPMMPVRMLHSGDAPLTIADFKGHVTLLNIWASWCDACRQEQAFLLQLAQQHVAVVGVNYQDRRDTAIAWLSRFGNPFDKVAYDPRGRMGIELGVYGTPETFLIDAEGIVRYRHAGVLTQKAWDEAFKPLVCALQPGAFVCGRIV